MNKKPLLSICVPTFNGASGMLKYVLDVLHIIAERHDNIEVVVSDNCSTDNTATLVKNYISTNLHYFINECNIGFNGNMLRLANKYAVGEYIWFVGDDDIINIDFFEVIINELSLRKADFFVLNYKTISNIDELKDFYHQEKGFCYCSYGTAIDRNCKDGNAFATFMGSQICNRDFFCNANSSMIGTGFNMYYDVFPNAFIAATAFYNKHCAFTDGIAIYPIFHKKEWNNLDNFSRLNSEIVFDMYDYIVSLGVPKSELKNTLERVIYLNIEVGLIRLRSLKRPSILFYKSLAKALFHPNVVKKIFKLIFN